MPNMENTVFNQQLESHPSRFMDRQTADAIVRNALASWLVSSNMVEDNGTADEIASNAEIGGNNIIKFDANGTTYEISYNFDQSDAATNVNIDGTTLTPVDAEVASQDEFGAQSTPGLDAAADEIYNQLGGSENTDFGAEFGAEEQQPESTEEFTTGEEEQQQMQPESEEGGEENQSPEETPEAPAPTELGGEENNMPTEEENEEVLTASALFITPELESAIVEAATEMIDAILNNETEVSAPSIFSESIASSFSVEYEKFINNVNSTDRELNEAFIKYIFSKND